MRNHKYLFFFQVGRGYRQEASASKATERSMSTGGCTAKLFPHDYITKRLGRNAGSVVAGGEVWKGNQRGIDQ